MGWDPRYLAVFVFIIAILLETVVIQIVLPMLARCGAVRENYRHDQVPVAGGLTFPITILLTYVLIQLTNGYTGNRFTLYLLAVTGMAFLGFIDDMLGQRDSLGFRGHFGRLLKRGELTTGALKALGGGMIAIYVSLFYSRSLEEFILNVLVIALFTNCMNLFDLRPGRCVKAFLLLFIPLLLVSDSYYTVFIPIAGAIVAYFPYDLKARVMMGDTGSNVLGVTLGIMAVYGLELPAKLALLTGLILLHIFTERYSLSKVIDNNRFLRWLDSLGRS